ncbi:hypothetical protein ACLB1O_08270 [Escherichia coli]
MFDWRKGLKRSASSIKTDRHNNQRYFVAVVGGQVSAWIRSAEALPVYGDFPQ